MPRRVVTPDDVTVVRDTGPGPDRVVEAHVRFSGRLYVVDRHPDWLGGRWLCTGDYCRQPCSHAKQTQRKIGWAEPAPPPERTAP